MMFGLPRLSEELRTLGLAVQPVTAPDGSPFAVIPDFEIGCGRFVGRVIDLGIQATPDFPRTVAAAIHIKATPQLYDFGDTVPGTRNIARSVLGPEWRYWSYNFGWNGEKTARRLISQINTIFAHA
jgi:hypothetical protein